MTYENQVVDRDKRNQEAASAATANNAVKADDNKPPMGLLPWPALVDVAKVLGFGAKKYTREIETIEITGRHNWRKGMDWSRMYDAALRHLTAFIEGENTDPESGLPHLAHCSCCILFLATYEKLKLGTDDRWKGL